MIELRLNNIIAEVDDKTIIGFEIQTYDVKEPGRPKVIISNNFTIPATSFNMKLIGFAGNPQIDSDAIYQKIDVKYIVDNDIIIENARARIETISDRIELFIYKKADVWDVFKATKIPEMLPLLLSYLATKYSYPTSTNKHSGTIGSFVDLFTPKQGIFLPYYFSNLSGYKATEEEPFFEVPDTITLADGLNQGGHFCIYLKDFLQFLEDEYDIYFQSNESFDGNIFEDPYFIKTFIPMQGITAYSSGGEYWLGTNTTELYSPLEDVSIKSDKSIYDLLTAYFKHFNILMDTVFFNGTFISRLYRFDDIDTKADVINWSGKLTGSKVFKPIVDGYGQSTYIKFSSIYEGGDAMLNSKKILVENENIEVEETITEIDSFICGFAKSLSNKLIPVLSSTEPFNGFTFFIESGITESVDVYLNSEHVVIDLELPALYSLSSEYLLLQEIMRKPKYYEVEKWLSLSDIRNLNFFAQYYIEELGGSFFINKIKGFNPAKKNTSTKLELIKIGNKTPRSTVDGNYWKDGFNNRFTDGKGNYFIW